MQAQMQQPFLPPSRSTRRSLLQTRNSDAALQQGSSHQPTGCKPSPPQAKRPQSERFSTASQISDERGLRTDFSPKIAEGGNFGEKSVRVRSCPVTRSLAGGIMRQGGGTGLDLGVLGDWGGLFAYRTRKTVLVKDRFLGLFYCVAAAFIFCFISYRIIFEKAYLDYEAVSGSVKLVLKGFSPGINPMREDYCRDMTCRLCDEHDVRYPNIDTRQVLVTTYVREARQHRVCDRNATECPFKSPYQTVAWDDYLVAGISHFSMNIEHSVQSPTFFFLTQDKRFRGNSRDMRGRLVSHKDGNIKVLKEFPANGEVDSITIGEIMQAAGIDLDTVLPGHIRPIRMTGTVIECHIHYFNDYSFFAPSNHIRYEYEFYAGSAQVESIDEPVHLGIAWSSPVDVEERMLLTRSGLKLVWTQDGALGKFSFSVLLLTLATGAVMFSIVRVIGDFVALNFLPRKHIYCAAMHEDTDGNSDTNLYNPAAGVREYGAVDRGSSVERDRDFD